jgi:hypothetical protein
MMSTVTVDSAMLHDILIRRDELVRAITSGMQSEDWDSVMRAFDGLLAAIARLEDSLARAGGA